MSAKLKLYHPTSRGTGCAIGLELHPATAEQEGSIILEMAHQRTVGEIIGKSEFDWSDTVCVRLGFNELTQIIQVFRGEREGLLGDYELYFYGMTIKHLSIWHVCDSNFGYALKVVEDTEDGKGVLREFEIFLNSAETLGICEAIAGAMVWVAFGYPHAPCRCAEGRAE